MTFLFTSRHGLPVTSNIVHEDALATLQRHMASVFCSTKEEIVDAARSKLTNPKIVIAKLQHRLRQFSFGMRPYEVYSAPKWGKEVVKIWRKVSTIGKTQR